MNDMIKMILYFHTYSSCFLSFLLVKGIHIYFSKGSELVVEGNLTSRQWIDKNGNNRETVELVVDRVHFCGPKRDSGSAEQAEPEFTGFEDDDIPF